MTTPAVAVCDTLFTVATQLLLLNSCLSLSSSASARGMPAVQFVVLLQDSVASVSTASSWKNYNIRSTQELVETVIKTAIDTDLDGAAALFNIDV